MYRVFDFSFFFKESIVRVIFGYYKRRILEEEDITRTIGIRVINANVCH